ncbi:MAG: gluconate 2-dehydrogenase subunit 3 family protein [Thermomicrobiales bacterium]
MTAPLHPDAPDRHNGAIAEPASLPPESPPDSAMPAAAPLHLVNRRHLLEMGAFTGAAAGIGLATHALGQESTPEASPEASPMAGMGDMDMSPQHANTNTGFSFFVPAQISILRAACNRLIPTDDSGPGAEEAGVVYFIDREMASRKNFRGPRYDRGPFVTGEATQGDQSAMPLPDRFRVGLLSMDAYAKSKYDGTGFAALTTDQQDQVLKDMSGGDVDVFGSISIDKEPLTPMASGGQPGITAQSFFSLLLSYTMAGFFSDPVHGGNHDMVGWKLIGFPGAHLSWADQIENYNKPFQGDYISLGQYQQQVGGES